MKANEIRELTLDADYRKAMQWIKNSALRGEFIVKLPNSEFCDLRKIHDKLVMDGFQCTLYVEPFLLEIKW